MRKHALICRGHPRITDAAVDVPVHRRPHAAMPAGLSEEEVFNFALQASVSPTLSPLDL
jgi:hypothetical protein